MAGFKALIISVGLIVTSAAASASPILNVSVSGTTGAYSYAYEIGNQTPVGLLLLSLTVTGSVGAIQSPTGWVDTTGVLGPGETLVDWVSTDVPYDVPAFGTLSVFRLHPTLDQALWHFQRSTRISASSTAKNGTYYFHGAGT